VPKFSVTVLGFLFKFVILRGKSQMKISKEKMGAAAIVLLILAVPLIQTSWGATEDVTAKDMVPAFLSDVVGLDLTKYNMTDEKYTVSYPSFYGGVVKDEVISYDLKSDNSELSVMGIFDNGFIYGLIVRRISGSIMFSWQPSTNAVDESSDILQRYKTFAENYGFDTSHIISALTRLNDATSASSLNADLHLFNNITGFVPSVTYAGNVKLETTEKRIRWIYTDRDVDMIGKIVSISFGSNSLSFRDTWNLFSVGSFSVISREEALQIALDAANNHDLTLVGANDTAHVVEKPGWSNRTSIALSMVPGEIYNTELNMRTQFRTGGNATRDPLMLYPLWKTVFYFSENVGHITGIQVGVWGDTKEIHYISAIGYLGAFPGENPDTSSSTEPLSDAEPSPDDLEMYPTVPILPSLDNLEGDVTSTLTSATQLEDPTESESRNPSTMILIGGIVATAMAIAFAVVLNKKRK
jgi:hypothetical protein